MAKTQTQTQFCTNLKASLGDIIKSFKRVMSSLLWLHCRISLCWYCSGSIRRTSLLSRLRCCFVVFFVFRFGGSRGRRLHWFVEFQRQHLFETIRNVIRDWVKNATSSTFGGIPNSGNLWRLGVSADKKVQILQTFLAEEIQTKTATQYLPLKYWHLRISRRDSKLRETEKSRTAMFPAFGRLRRTWVRELDADRGQ